MVATGMHTVYTSEEIHDYGWRLPFLLGGIFGFVAMYLRRWLHETPIFKEMQESQELAVELPIKSVLKNHASSVFVSMAVTWVLTAAVVVTILMTPSLLQKLVQLDPKMSLEANSVAIICVFIGSIICGALADRFGNGLIMIIFSIGLAISYWVFYSTMLNDTTYLFPLYALVGFFAGLVGVVPAIAVKSFPAAIRFSGLSFSYNVAYAIFGGTTPMVVSLMLSEDPLSPVYYVAFVCGVGVLAGLAVMRYRSRLDLIAY